MLDPNLLNSEQFSSLGNIVTAGLRLYLMRFKPYLRMAIAAHLWLLIPVYGWAKFCSFSVLMAQQSFYDLVRSSEPLASLQQQVSRPAWSVLITNVIIIIRVGLVALLTLILSAFATGIIEEFILTAFSVSVPKLNPVKPFSEPFGLTIGLGIYLFSLVTAIGFYSRYFVVELPLALECDYKPTKAMKRCRNLTKGSTFFGFGVITVVFVLTCPLSYLIAEIFFRLINLVLRTLPLNFSTRRVVGYSLIALLGLFLNAVTMPCWQATKAALYYRLRSRREGFDLQLRNPDRPTESA